MQRARGRERTRRLSDKKGSLASSARTTGELKSRRRNVIPFSARGPELAMTDDARRRSDSCEWQAETDERRFDYDVQRLTTRLSVTQRRVEVRLRTIQGRHGGGVPLLVRLAVRLGIRSLQNVKRTNRPQRPERRCHDRPRAAGWQEHSTLPICRVRLTAPVGEDKTVGGRVLVVKGGSIRFATVGSSSRLAFQDPP